ncbi:MAG: DUF3379 family protein [Burkholderiales bacterium]
MPSDARAHALECPHCAEFARSMNAFEGKLESAVRIPVDPTLAERIVLNQKLKGGRRNRVMAIAASFLLIASLVGGIAYRHFAPDLRLLNASVDHVMGEPGALTALQVVSKKELVLALANSGGSLKQDFANAVVYLHDCPVPGGVGKHMVWVTPRGKVTLITMPNQRVLWRVDGEYKGLITALMPAGRGSYAIVADNEAALKTAEAMVGQHIAWRT